MSSCRECVHHILCPIYFPNCNDILANGGNCSAFKNESNFVEVVRCKDCKWWINEKCKNINGAYGNLIFNPNWFCCAGERDD